MRKTLILAVFFIPILSFAQSSEDDELTFEAAVDWLDRKLNYIYYDRGAEKWWINKFYVSDKKEVTIKNISTDKPLTANIKEKVYLIRTFQIQDINPYQINIREVPEDQGRIAKGKLLELKTYEHQRLINKTTNGRRASSTSFVHISFPTFLTDSIADYAELVSAKLSEAIIASTKVYRTGNFEEDKKKVFDILSGKFRSKENEAITVEKQFENVFAITGKEGSVVYFGFTPSTQLFYVTEITNEKTSTIHFELIEGEKLILQNPEKSSDFIEFETLNSIRLLGTTYYRE